MSSPQNLPSSSPEDNPGTLAPFDEAVLSAVQRDIWLGDLFNADGYPQDQAVEKITLGLRLSVEDGLALRNVYYSLKFLKSVGLVDDFGANEEALRAFETTGRFANHSGGFFSLAAKLNGSADLIPVSKEKDTASESLISQAVDLSGARERAHGGGSFTCQEFAYVLKPLFTAYDLLAKQADPFIIQHYPSRDIENNGVEATERSYQNAADQLRRGISETNTFEWDQLQAVSQALLKDMREMRRFYDVATRAQDLQAQVVLRQFEEDLKGPITVEPMTIGEATSLEDADSAQVADNGQKEFRPFGLIGELAGSLSSKVPVEYLFADLVVRFGAECRGRLFMETGDGLIPSRQYMVLVDGSGAGKSRSADVVANVFREHSRPSAERTGEICVIDGAGSDRYVFAMLEESHDVLLSLDELDLLISKSKISGSMLLQAVTSLYSKGEFRSGTKKEKIEVTSGRLSLRAGCTASTFDTVAGSEAMRLGFVNRLWIVRAGENPILGLHSPEKARQLGRALMQAIPSQRTVVAFDKEGEQLFENWKTSLPKDEITKRLDEIAYRLMPVLAITSEKRVADREVVEYTTWLMDRHHAHRLTVFPVDGKNPMAMLENKIRREMSKFKKLTMGELRRRVHAQREGEFYFRNAFGNVEKSGDIRIEGNLVSWTGETDFSPEQACLDMLREEAQATGRITSDRLHTLLSGKLKAERARLAQNAGLEPKMVKLPGVCRPVEMWFPKVSD